MAIARSYLIEEAYTSLPQRFIIDLIMREIEVLKHVSVRVPW